jgi:hypothetical protein
LSIINVLTPEPVPKHGKPVGARDCSGNPFGEAKRFERKARFAAFYAVNAPKFRIENKF